MQRDLFESSPDDDFLMKHGGFCVHQQSLFTKCVQNRGALKFKVGKMLVDAGGRPTYYDLLPCNNLDNRMHTRYSSN